MKRLGVILASIPASVAIAALKATVSAAQIRTGVEAAHSEGQPREIFVEGGIFTTAVDLLLFIVGVVAVVMIIFGGFRYIISGGNASSVTAAKNTILYAIVGVIIALLSYAIVDFVVESFSAGGTTGL
jgi:hypothetical protein